MAYCNWNTLYEYMQQTYPQSRDMPASRFYDNLLLNAGSILANTVVGTAEYVSTHNAYLLAAAEKIFYRNRKPFIHLYPGIAELLATTKINIPCDECQLPFDSFVINLPTQTDILIEGIKGCPCGCGETSLPLCGILVSYASKELASMVCASRNARVIQVTWKSVKPPTHEPFIESLLIDLESGRTIEEQINSSIASAKQQGAKTSDAEIQLIYRITLGAIFLTISKDRRYVDRERVRVSNNDPCICGSGLKYKNCCKPRGAQNTGFEIGRNLIRLPHKAGGVQIVGEEIGRELRFGHLRSGHMRWQNYKDEQGDWVRKLIFIHPLIVRPDLPLKPKTTPREIRERNPSCIWHRFNPDEDIRRLERDANLGDVNAEARLIIAKVRAGIIPAKHVAIAAYLEDPAALATGIEPWDDDNDDVPDWVGSGDVRWSKVRKVLRFGGLPQKILANSAADFAEHVLHIFEDAHPEDTRPRLAIQVVRNLTSSEKKKRVEKIGRTITIERAASAAIDAADSDIVALNASNAANAAAYAAWAASTRTGQSKLAAATNAAHSAYEAVSAIRTRPRGLRTAEVKWQAQRLCDYLLDRRSII